MGMAETADFMDALYGRLRAGESPAMALSRVRRDAIDAGKPASAWAAFVLVGRL